MWSKLAELYGWKIPPQEMERLAASLDDLAEKSRRVLNRDLSTVEPVPAFRPGSEEAGEAE